MKYFIVTFLLVTIACGYRGNWNAVYYAKFNDKLTYIRTLGGPSQKIKFGEKVYTIPGFYDLYKYASVGDSLVKKSKSFKIIVYKMDGNKIIEKKEFDNNDIYVKLKKILND